MNTAPRPDLLAARRHWRQTQGLTLVLLGIWLSVTLVTGLYPELLNQRTFLGFPFGFYLAAQGTLLAYLLLVGLHTLIMNAIDRRYLREAKATKTCAHNDG